MDCKIARLGAAVRGKSQIATLDHRRRNAKMRTGSEFRGVWLVKAAGSNESGGLFGWCGGFATQLQTVYMYDAYGLSACTPMHGIQQRSIMCYYICSDTAPRPALTAYKPIEEEAAPRDENTCSATLIDSALTKREQSLYR
jgi:hypothetical protein